MTEDKHFSPEEKIAAIVGSLFILAGILFNEWMLTALLSPDGDISAHNRIVIWGYDILSIGLGVMVISYRKRIIRVLRGDYIALERFLLYSVFSGLVISFLLFLYVAYRLITFGYPNATFDDWILYGAGRIANGQPIYLDPSTHHPLVDIYPPGLLIFLAPFVKFFGYSHHMAQLLIVLTALADGALIYTLIKRRGGSALFSCLFALLFYSMYFTCTRQTLLIIAPSAFILLFVLMILYLLTRWESEGRLWQFVLMVLIQGVAVYFKQTTVFYGLAVCVYLTLKGKWPAALIYLGSSIVVVGGVFVVGNYSSKGMWLHYLVMIPQMAPFVFSKLRRLAAILVRILPISIVLIFSIYYLYRRGWRDLILPELVFLCILFPFAMMGFLRLGGGLNQFIESSALVSVLLGIVTSLSVGRQDPWNGRIRTVVLLGVLAYGIMNLFLVRPIYPDRDAKNSGIQISSIIEERRPHKAIAHCFTSFIYKNTDAEFVNTGLGTNFYLTEVYDSNRIRQAAEKAEYDVILLVHAWTPEFLQEALYRKYQLIGSYPYVPLIKQLDLYIRKEDGTILLENTP